MPANDGQTLEGQSPQTIADFVAVYGDNASAAWEAEHNAELGGPATGPAPAPVGPAAPVAPVAPAAPTVPQTANPYGGYGAQDILAAFQAGSGYSVQRLEEEKRQFDAELAWRREQMERVGIPQIEINRRLAEMQDQHFQSQMSLATRQQTFLEKMQSGQMDLATARLELDKLTQLGQLGVSRGTLGLNYLTQAAQFAASDPFALSDFMRGAQNQGAPQFIQALQQGLQPGYGYGAQNQAPGAITFGSLSDAMGGPQQQPGAVAPPQYAGRQATGFMEDPNMPTFSGTGPVDGGFYVGGGYTPPGAPTRGYPGVADQTPTGTPPASGPYMPHITALSAPGTRLSGGQGTNTGMVGPFVPRVPGGPGGPSPVGPTSINPQTNAALAGIGNIFQGGANRLAVGSLESLDSNELNTFAAGIRRLYGEQAVPAFLEQYKRSRPMQTAARTSYQY